MRLPVPAIALLAALLPAAAVAQPVVSKVSLLVFEEEFAGVPQGWYLQVEINGTGISSASIAPPAKSPINVPGSSTQRKFESARFASLAALQQEFPPSDAMDKYVITLNGPTTLNLDFQPVAPDDFARTTFPMDGDATLDTTPTFTVSNGCTNCNVQVVFVEDLSFSGVQIESFVFGPPFPTSLDLPDFAPVVSELPLDTYEVCTSAANGLIDEDFVEGGQIFEFERAAVAEDCVEFGIVPQANVTEVEIAIGEQLVDGGSLGWYFGVEVVGGDLLAATLTPPGGATLDLEPAESDRLSLVVGPFSSLAELQTIFPPDSSGGYTIGLNGGVSTVGLDFDPVVPDGVLQITTPTPDQLLGSRPSFFFSNGCTNCGDLFAELFDDNTGGSLVWLDADFSAPLPSRVDFTDFGANQGSLGPIDELPDAFYVIDIAVANETISTESFTPPDGFDLYSGAFRGDVVRFEAPEPGSGALAIAVLVTIAALRQRDPRRG